MYLFLECICLIFKKYLFRCVSLVQESADVSGTARAHQLFGYAPCCFSLFPEEIHLKSQFSVVKKE